jgi:hypothetical protein
MLMGTGEHVPGTLLHQHRILLPRATDGVHLANFASSVRVLMFEFVQPGSPQVGQDGRRGRSLFRILSSLSLSLIGSHEPALRVCTRTRL